MTQEMQAKTLDQEDANLPGVENGNLFQYSCLENPMDRAIRKVANSQTRLSEHKHTPPPEEIKVRKIRS